ncbi:Os08g0235266 [Oryza sativa Japonica Group]|uniref:Os08g0235266 protein n=1 Tax=Oryza sativa subsp. japonica TaxID=39947 RepID=A0A0P0XDA0_ORYSJ|nr:Os08g0235266 [Oryza sativa Japonica Group]
MAWSAAPRQHSDAGSEADEEHVRKYAVPVRMIFNRRWRRPVEATTSVGDAGRHRPISRVSVGHPCPARAHHDRCRQQGSDDTHRELVDDILTTSGYRQLAPWRPGNGLLRRAADDDGD